MRSLGQCWKVLLKTVCEDSKYHTSVCFLQGSTQMHTVCKLVWPSIIEKSKLHNQQKTDFLSRITKILMALDGPSWREKLLRIPTVPTSAQLRAWQPVAEPPPDQGGDSCSHHQLGIIGKSIPWSFLWTVVVSCACILTVKQKDDWVNSGIRPGLKLAPCSLSNYKVLKVTSHSILQYLCVYERGRWE